VPGRSDWILTCESCGPLPTVSGTPTCSRNPPSAGAATDTVPILIQAPNVPWPAGGSTLRRRRLQSAAQQPAPEQQVAEETPLFCLRVLVATDAKAQKVHTLPVLRRGIGSEQASPL
jgi:hypothetical protein